VSFDLANFFESITGDQVFSVFRRITKVDTTAQQLTMLCTVMRGSGTDPRDLSKRYLVQGACTSPTLSNLVCLDMDRRLHGLLKNTFPDWKMSRYADDLTFSSKKRHLDVGQLRNAVKRIVESCGFRMNEDKFSVHRDATALPVTGLLVSNSVRVPARFLDNVRAMLHNGLKSGGLTPSESDRLIATLGYVNYVNTQQFKAFVDKNKTCLDQPAIGRMYTRAANLDTENNRVNLYKKVKLIVRCIERLGPNRASFVKDRPILSELRLLLRGYWIYDRPGWRTLADAHPWVEGVMRRTDKTIEINGKSYGTHYAWHPYQLTYQRDNLYIYSPWNVIDEWYLHNDVVRWNDSMANILSVQKYFSDDPNIHFD
jgi:hypothetical protein